MDHELVNPVLLLELKFRRTTEYIPLCKQRVCKALLTGLQQNFLFVCFCLGFLFVYFALFFKFPVWHFTREYDKPRPLQCS